MEGPAPGFDRNQGSAHHGGRTHHLNGKSIHRLVSHHIGSGDADLTRTGNMLGLWAIGDLDLDVLAVQFQVN